MDELIDVIEVVGKLNDSAEASKWEVARAVNLAFAEFPAYTRGLTEGLCQRIRKSADSLYGYRNAAILQEKLGIGDILSVSHFVCLCELGERYKLTKEKMLEWLDHAKDCNMSVREIRSAISTAHQEDERAHFNRKVSKIVKLMERVYQDAGALQMPESLYQETKTTFAVISDWVASVGEWI